MANTMKLLKIWFPRGCSCSRCNECIVITNGNTFIADTYVNEDPSPEELTEITLMAADTVRRFGIEPKVALLSRSSFGSDCALHKNA